MKPKRVRSKSVLAATFGWDSAEVGEYEYQPGRFSKPVFSIGSDYFSVGSLKPTADVGGPWEPYSDQFFAAQAGTILWHCKAIESTGLTRHMKIS